MTAGRTVAIAGRVAGRDGAAEDGVDTAQL